MKAVVGFLFFLLFLAGFFLVFIQGKQMASQNPLAGDAKLTGVSWRPIYVGAESVPEDAGLIVQFELDGSIKGHGGCNSFFGSLETTEAGMTGGPPGRTRKGWPRMVNDRERGLLGALQENPVF